jgi:hypothetical protein
MLAGLGSRDLGWGVRGRELFIAKTTVKTDLT